MGTPEQSAESKELLIKIASDVFAENGYDGATIRQIARRADVGLGAINYHFGDKEGLYRAVMERAMAAAVGAFEKFQATAMTPVERLEAYIRLSLTHVLDERRLWPTSRLWRNEISRPSAIFPQFVDSGIARHYGMLVGIITEMMGEGADEATARAMALGVVGHCLHFHFAGHVVTRLTGHQHGPEDIEPLTRQITDIWIAAIGAMAARGRSGANPLAHPAPKPGRTARWQ